MQTIALYTTETMADWEYAYLTTRIAAVEAVRPGRFRLLLVGDGLAPVRSLGGLPLSPAADLDELAGLVDDGSLAVLVIPGGNHSPRAGTSALPAPSPTCLLTTCPWPPSAGPRTSWPATGSWMSAATHRTPRTSSSPAATGAATAMSTPPRSPTGASPPPPASTRSPSPPRSCGSRAWPRSRSSTPGSSST